MNSRSEAELIAACREGEEEAWDCLFERHYSAAGHFIFQLTPSLMPEDVKEICQETFLAAIQHIDSFKGNCQFRTWLFRIAANKTRDFLQRQNAAKRGSGQVPLSLQDSAMENRSPLDPVTDSPAPDDAVICAERLALVRKSLDALNDPCREVIELRYFAELSYEEIADALALNPKTVSSRLSKCLDRLELIVRELWKENSLPFSV